MGGVTDVSIVSSRAQRKAAHIGQTDGRTDGLTCKTCNAGLYDLLDSRII